MPKLSSFLALILMLAGRVLAQPSDTLWTRSFGGAMLDEFYELTTTLDGGYVTVGGTRSFGAGDIDMWVVKTDSVGTLVWDRTFGGIYDDRAQAVLENPDGTLMIAGRISGDTSRYLDAALLKLSNGGDSLWGQIYGGSRDESLRGIVAVADGGYVLAGYTRSFGAGAADFWLLKVSDTGDSIWSRTYGGTASEFALEIQSVPDGGYALAGHTGSFDVGGQDMWLLKVNRDGDSLWSQVYGGFSLEECRGMCTTNDGGFLLVGDTDSYGQGDWNGYAVKVDSIGNMQWQRALGQGIQAILEDVLELSDGSFVSSGYYTHDVGDARAWLVRLNGEGDSLWSRQWGTPQTICSATSVVRTADGGYVMAGLRDYELSWQTGDGWLLKTEEDPLSANKPGPIIPQEITLSVYPNPFNAQSTLALTIPHAERVNVILYDLLGRDAQTLADDFYTPGEHRIMISGEALASGVYFISAQTPSQRLIQKLLLIK